MSSLIPITGIGPDFRTPGAYAEILFAQGPASAAAGAREVVIVMPKLSTGTWTAATLYGPLANEKEADTGAGAGSPLHRAVRMFLKENKDAKVWALPVAETTGGSPIAATAVLTIATTATGRGTLTVTICGEECAFTFASGATATQIGDGIVEAINTKTWLPCTASNAAGTVTLTAKLKGISQGTATVAAIRVRASITSGVATTASFGGAFLGTGAAGVEGSTTEATNATTALATIDAVRKYYLVSNGNSATYLGNIQTHITNKSEPRRGYRSVGIVAYVGTQAAAQTLATARNYERLDLICQANSDHDPAELSALWAAGRQKLEGVDSAWNFDGWTSPNLRPAYDPADWPDGDDQSDAINDGVTVVASTSTTAYVVMSCTTRSKNSTGSVDDFRACESHRVSVADEFVDETLIDYALNFASKKLANDEFLANGAVNTNQKQIRNVVKPSVYKKTMLARLQAFEDAGKIQDAAASKESCRVLKSTANAGRLESGLDLHVIDLLHQLTVRCAEVSTG